MLKGASAAFHPKSSWSGKSNPHVRVTKFVNFDFQERLTVLQQSANMAKIESF
jgi:hypothetical protein